jgi:hypothetical protein
MRIKRRHRRNESGNVIFFILLGIVLIALVTAAVRSGGGEGENIDREQTAIAASQIRQYASELERGTAIILQSGVSEADIRFAYPDAPSDYGDITVNPTRQVFDPKGGGVHYQKPPAGANGGETWEFYGQTHAPQVGSPSRSDLIAVLPDVAADICNKLNKMSGYNPATHPTDSGACVNSGASKRFGDATQYEDVSPNTMDENNFTVKPATEACVTCDDGKFYFYHVLIAR